MQLTRVRTGLFTTWTSFVEMFFFQDSLFTSSIQRVRTYIIALLPLSHLPDPIAFCNIVGKEEDAEKEEDMKNSKQNEKEAIAVVSARTCLYVCIDMY